jgi:uncharacterized protein YndB with AHSA1/START domain
MAAKNKSNELHLTRIYDAPAKMVWEAWTDPKKAAHWWGPRGFTITTQDKEFRAGGHWTYTMHAPDGTNYPYKTRYLEVEKYSRLVYDHGSTDDTPPLFRVTVVFTEIKEKTKMDMTMSLATPEAAAEIEKFIKKAGGDSTWDRLAEYLNKEALGKEQFVINRSFSMPIETMFEMWKNPAHFAKWIAPGGMETKFIRADIKAGGSTFFCMSPNGTHKMYGRADYLEVEKPNRIVYAQQFCDENEKVIRHPMSPNWPETMLTTVVFSAEGSDQTRVTVTWEPRGKVTSAELETFIQSKVGMTQGWGGSFDQLEAHLEKSAL